MRVAYGAGVEPRFRAGRRVSNDPGLEDGNVDIVRAVGQISVQLSNFDDVAFTGVVFSVTTTSGDALTAWNTPPTVVLVNSAAAAIFKYSGTHPGVQATVTYTNPRTERTTTLAATG